MRDPGKWLQNILVLENAKAEQSLEKLFFSEITCRKFRLHKLSKHGKTAYIHLRLVYPMELGPVSQACMSFSYHNTFEGLLRKKLVQKPPVTPFRVAHQCACSTSL